jgi:hypothetical protein
MRGRRARPSRRRRNVLPARPAKRCGGAAAGKVDVDATVRNCYCGGARRGMVRPGGAWPGKAGQGMVYSNYGGGRWHTRQL